MLTGRRRVRINGVEQVGGFFPKEPEFLDALAYWKMMDHPAFLDESANMLDFAGVLGTQQIHPLYGGIVRGYATGSLSISDPLLRITGDVTLHVMLASDAPSGRFDLQCYSTGDTDCLYGFGVTGGNIRVWDKSLPGGFAYALKNSQVIQTPYSGGLVQYFAVRSGTTWYLYAQGELQSTVTGATTNTAIGNEVFLISLTSVSHSYSHIAIWDSALSAERIKTEYKSAFGR